MTLAEKMSQLVNNIAGVPHLDIPDTWFTATILTIAKFNDKNNQFVGMKKALGDEIPRAY